jgi:hypothetical protein
MHTYIHTYIRKNLEIDLAMDQLALSLLANRKLFALAARMHMHPSNSLRLREPRLPYPNQPTTQSIALRWFSRP